MATVAARAVMRLATASSRSAAIRISNGVKPKAAGSPFRISPRTPLTARIFRTPVELNGASLVSMLPYHTATASALLNSMLSVAPHGHAWTLEALLSQKLCRKFFGLEEKRGLDMKVARRRRTDFISWSVPMMDHVISILPRLGSETSVDVYAKLPINKLP